MRPVAIFRFSPTEGPGFFAEWLQARGVPYEIIALDEGAPVPADVRRYAGLGMATATTSSASSCTPR
jgi:hypothetical protein